MKIHKSKMISALIPIGSLILTSAVLAYADCTYEYFPNCSGPPINQYDTGIGYDSCGGYHEHDFYVTKVPTKSFAGWANVNGLDNYFIYSYQCSVGEGFLKVDTNCGQVESVYFTVYGAAEDAAVPSGNNCYAGG